MSSEASIDTLRAQHGKVVHLKVGGQDFVFRRPRRAELVHFQKVARAQPDLALDHSIGLCRACFVGPGSADTLESAFESSPLAFAGNQEFDGVTHYLIDLAKGDAEITVK